MINKQTNKQTNKQMIKEDLKIWLFLPPPPFGGQKLDGCVFI